MSQAPFSFLNYLSLSSFKGLNWFEGLKRIKIFLQWLWGVPVGLGIVLFSAGQLLHGGLSFEVFFWEIVILSPILGFELLFRAVVWIVAGFLHSGDSKSQAVEMAQAHQTNEIKKKLTDSLNRWMSELKKTKPHHVLCAIFSLLWFYIWCELVTRGALCPISHWKSSGFSYPFRAETMGWLESFRLIWYILVTILRGVLAFIVLLFGYHLYISIETTILQRQKQTKEPKN